MANVLNRFRFVAAALLYGILSSLTWTTAVEAAELPSTVPGYFAAAFDIGGVPLRHVDHKEEPGAEQYVLASTDGDLAVVVNDYPCQRPECQRIYDSVLSRTSTLIADKVGIFEAVNSSDARASFRDGGKRVHLGLYRLPTRVQFWTYLGPPSSTSLLETKLDEVGDMMNRRRFEEALAKGNVAMGVWADSIHAFAELLFEAGNRQGGLTVLRRLLQTSPGHLGGHADYMVRIADQGEARRSAELIMRRSENTELMQRAATVLDRHVIGLADIPVLEQGRTGLQAVLIALPPCEPWLLQEAGKVYEQITGIPVATRRLEETWQFDQPERIARQRDIERLLIRLRGQGISFDGWDGTRYVSELRAATIDLDPLSRFQVDGLIDDALDKEGQYDGSRYVDRLAGIIGRYSANDFKTMYVGVTSADIYSGDTNYVFSIGGRAQQTTVNLLSYRRMLSSTYGEPPWNQPRLVERMAKELVPATLKGLGIPRPTDPGDPYSYSSGIQRTDEKTLKLSPPTMTALERFRDPETKRSPWPKSKAPQ